jgi:TP901 family phage tail tape measure protein
VAAQTLAEAALLVIPDFSRATQGAVKAGESAGTQYAQGFKRGSDGKLRDAHGKFVNDSEVAGGKSGAALAKGHVASARKGILGGLKDIAKVSAGFLIPAGIGAAVSEIAKIGMAYEDNLNVFKAITKATGAQMDQVGAKARALGADVKLPGVSAAGAAEAMTELAKSGLSVAQAMDAARGTLQLARAAGIDEAKAAEITGNAINAFGLKAKDATFVVDELAAAANSSSVEINDVSLAFKMAASVFSGFQGPAVGSKEAITELNTAIAILGNNGIKGSDAGTSLKQMLLQLTGPTDQAKGLMKELALNAAGANISLEQQTTVLHGSKKERHEAIAEILKHNKGMADGGDIAFTASGKMRPLKDIIDLVTRGTKDMTQEERAYTLTQVFGADATRAVIALMKGGLPTYEKQRRAVMQVGAAADVAAAKNAGLKGAIDNVRSQLENAAISIYNSVKGPLTKGLNDFAGQLSETFDWIGKHIHQLTDIAKVAGLGAAAWATYTLAVKGAAAASIIFAAAQTAIAWLGLLKTVRSFRDLWVLLDMAMAANPIGLVVVAIAALVVGVIYAYKHFGWFKTAVDATWKAIQIGFKAALNWIVNTAWPWLVKAWHGIADAAQWAWEKVIKPVINALIVAWHAVATAGLWLWHNVIEPVWHGIMVAVKVASAIVQLAAAILVAYYKNVVGPVFMWLWKYIVKPSFDNIVLIVKIAIAAVKLIWSALVSYYKNVVGPAFMWLWKNITKPAFDGIKIAVEVMWKLVKPILMSVVNFVTKNMPAAFRAGVAAMKIAWEVLKTAALTPITFVVKYVINPLIKGFNALAGVFHTPTIPTIPGFADGGQIPGPASSKDNRWAVVRDKGQVLGTTGLATGEYVVNAKSTAANLHKLVAINKARGPVGDGYADGGVVGKIKGFFGGLVNKAKSVASAIADPSAAMTKLFNDALSHIPGDGPFVNIIRGMATKIADGLKGLLSSAWSSTFGGGGDASGIGANASPGFPPWPSSPGAQRGDSGVWRSVVALIKSTGPVSGSFGNSYRAGDPLWHGSGRAVDWMGYNQDTLAGFLSRHRPLELIHRSSLRDYAYTRGQNRGSFNEALMQAHRNHVHIAMEDGGLNTAARFGKIAKVSRADYGSVILDPGANVVHNGLGRPEYLTDPTLSAGRLHPDDMDALAEKIGEVLARALMGTVPATRVAARQAGRRPTR